MTHNEYERAANHWKVKDADNARLDKEKLMVEVEKYINANNTCALATGNGSFVRCTPIEYTYHDGALWMFSEGGRKFISLEVNKNVSVAIFDKYDGFGNLKGMQITGVADIVEPFSAEYITAAEYKKIPVDALKKLPELMNLIKISPVVVEYLNSEFKKEGYSSRQVLEV